MFRLAKLLCLIALLVHSGAKAEFQPSTNNWQVLLTCFTSQQITDFQRKLCAQLLDHTLEADQTLDALYLEHQRNLLNLNKAADDYIVEGDRITAAITERQLVYHPIILASVLVIVLCALALTFMQVKHAPEPGESSFEVTKEGLKIKSPVIGLLILCVSLVFFYLYLTNVYRLTLLDSLSSGAHAPEHSKQ